MSDLSTLGLAAKAVVLVSNTVGLLKQAREAAKNSDDHDLKDKLSEVFDEVINLKDAVIELKQENVDLRKQLDQRGNLRWDGRLQVYFLEGDKHPFCPRCWDNNAKLIRLHGAIESGSSEPWQYTCQVCRNCFRVPD